MIDFVWSAFTDMPLLAAFGFGLPALYVIGKLVELVSYELVHGPRAAFMKDFDAFLSDASARGVGAQDVLTELKVREAFARLRREASDAVRVNVGGWKDELDRCTKAAFERLRDEDPALLPLLGGMIEGLDYSHILRAPEARAVHDLEFGRHARLRFAPNIDMQAALRIVG